MMWKVDFEVTRILGCIATSYRRKLFSLADGSVDDRRRQVLLVSWMLHGKVTVGVRPE